MLKPVDAAIYFPPHPNFFTGRGTVVATRANLPHWNKANTAAFVTFRLADSLPRGKLLALEERRTAWIASHPQPWDEAAVHPSSLIPPPSSLLPHPSSLVPHPSSLSVDNSVFNLSFLCPPHVETLVTTCR